MYLLHRNATPKAGRIISPVSALPDLPRPTSMKNGPRFSSNVKAVPALRKQARSKTLMQHLDMYHRTKKWFVTSDLLSKFRVYCTHISDQAAADHIAKLSMLTFRNGELQLAHNLCVLFVDKLSLPMFDEESAEIAGTGASFDGTPPGAGMRRLRESTRDFEQETNPTCTTSAFPDGTGNGNGNGNGSGNGNGNNSNGGDAATRSPRPSFAPPVASPLAAKAYSSRSPSMGGGTSLQAIYESSRSESVTDDPSPALAVASARARLMDDSEFVRSPNGKSRKSLKNLKKMLSPFTKRKTPPEFISFDFAREEGSNTGFWASGSSPQSQSGAGSSMDIDSNSPTQGQGQSTFTSNISSPPVAALNSQTHIPMLKQLSVTNPALFQLYWKAMDRMIMVALMRGHLAVAEGIYAIFSDNRNPGPNGGSSDGMHTSGSTLTMSREGSRYSGSGRHGESISSDMSHLSPVMLLKHTESHQLNAILSTLLILAGNHRDASRAMDMAISTVDPTRDQLAWASCLLHRSLHSAAFCNFYDARVDLIGASRSFSAVSDSNLSMSALVLRGWYGMMSGDGLHDLDVFIDNMDSKIASDAAVQQKNMFLRRSLGNDNMRATVGNASNISNGSNTTPTSKTGGGEGRERAPTNPENTNSGGGLGRRNSVESVSGQAVNRLSNESRRDSVRASIRIDNMSVALERMRTDASEMALGNYVTDNDEDGSVAEADEGAGATPSSGGGGGGGAPRRGGGGGGAPRRGGGSGGMGRQATGVSVTPSVLPDETMSLSSGMLPSHLIQWIDDLALVRLFIKADYQGVKHRDARIRARRKRDVSTYVASVLLANIACKEGRLAEACRLTMYSARKGTSRDTVHPASCFILFLVGLAAVSTMEAMISRYAYISLLVDEDDYESDDDDEEEDDDVDSYDPTEFDSIDQAEYLQIVAHRRDFKHLHRAVLVIINALAKIDFCVFPGFMLLRYILIAKKNRIWRMGSLREFLVSYDHIIDDTPPQFLLGLAYAYEEREHLCIAIGISSEILPCENARRTYPSGLVARALFAELAFMKYSDAADITIEEG
jgi:hypothetical protein